MIILRILVVEDEPNLNELLVKRLKIENYSVDSCPDGAQALEFIESCEYDAIVLDIMLPRVSGLEILQRIRDAGSKTPVLLLTARDSIQDRVAGLNLGADDYLVKPFAFPELLARIRVLLRRSSDNISSVFRLADLIVDSAARTVARGDVPITLSSKEFAILEYMLHNRGTVLSRDKISRHIWNYDYEGVSNVVDVYIRYLRKKIDDDFSPKLIHTVRGAGYVLREEE